MLSPLNPEQLFLEQAQPFIGLAHTQPGPEGILQAVLTQIDLNVVAIAEDRPIPGLQVDADELMKFRLAELGQSAATVTPKLL